MKVPREYPDIQKGKKVLFKSIINNNVCPNCTYYAIIISRVCRKNRIICHYLWIVQRNLQAVMCCGYDRIFCRTLAMFAACLDTDIIGVKKVTKVPQTRLKYSVFRPSFYHQRSIPTHPDPRQPYQVNICANIMFAQSRG